MRNHVYLVLAQGKKGVFSLFYLITNQSIEYHCKNKTGMSDVNCDTKLIVKRKLIM